MPYLLIRHKVKDYETWKPLFDEHSNARGSYGSKGGPLFRSADDPTEVVVLLEVDDLDRARAFTQDPDLRETMQRAGVTDQPDLYFLEQAEVLSM
jgi:hypothetical protein